MTKDTIASETLYGWRMKTNHSKVALEWLHWQDSQFSEPRIQYAGNTDEYLIPNNRYTVDGYDAETNSTIYDFQACFCYGYMPLYPYVNKKSEYPLGHPKIIFQPGHTDISHYFGIVQCTALPSP